MATRKSFNTPPGEALINIIRKPLEIPQLFDILPKRQLLFQVPTGMFDPFCHTLTQLRDIAGLASSCTEGSASSFSEIDDPELKQYCQERVSSWVTPGLTYGRFLNPTWSPYPNDDPDPTEDELQRMCDKLKRYLGLSVDDNDGLLLLRFLARLIIDLQGEVPAEIEALIYNSQMMLKYVGSCTWEGNQYSIKVIDVYQEGHPPLNMSECNDLHARDVCVSMGFRYGPETFIDSVNSLVMSDNILYNERWSMPCIVKGYVPDVKSLSSIACNIGDRYGVYAPTTVHPVTVYEWSGEEWIIAPIPYPYEEKKTMYWETIPVTPHNTYKNPDTIYLEDHRILNKEGVCTSHSLSISGGMYVPNICLNRDRLTAINYVVTFIDTTDGEAGAPYEGCSGAMTWQKVWDDEDTGDAVYGYTAHLSSDLDSNGTAEELGLIVIRPDGWGSGNFVPNENGTYDALYYDVTKPWIVEHYWRLSTYYRLDAGVLYPMCWSSGGSGTVTLKNQDSHQPDWSWSRVFYVYKGKGSRLPQRMTEEEVKSQLKVTYDCKITEDPMWFPGFSIDKSTGDISASGNGLGFPFYVQVEVNLKVEPEWTDESDVVHICVDRFDNTITASRRAFLWQASKDADSTWQSYPPVYHGTQGTAWGFWSNIPKYKAFKDPFGTETQAPNAKCAVCVYSADFSEYHIEDAFSEWKDADDEGNSNNTMVSFETKLTPHPAHPSSMYENFVILKGFSITVNPGDITCKDGYYFRLSAVIYFGGIKYPIMFPTWDIKVNKCPYYLESVYTGYEAADGQSSLSYSGSGELLRTSCEGNELLVIPQVKSGASYGIIINPAYAGGSPHEAYCWGAVHTNGSALKPMSLCPLDTQNVFCDDVGLITVDYSKPSSDGTSYFTSVSENSDTKLYKIKVAPPPSDTSISVDTLTNFHSKDLSGTFLRYRADNTFTIKPKGKRSVLITKQLTYSEALSGITIVVACYESQAEASSSHFVVDAQVYALNNPDQRSATITGVVYHDSLIRVHIPAGFFVMIGRDGEVFINMNVNIMLSDDGYRFTYGRHDGDIQVCAFFSGGQAISQDYNEGENMLIRYGDMFIQWDNEHQMYFKRAERVNSGSEVVVHKWSIFNPYRYRVDSIPVFNDGRALVFTNRTILIDEANHPVSPYGFVSRVHNYTMFTNDNDHASFDFIALANSWLNKTEYNNGTVSFTTRSYSGYVVSVGANVGTIRVKKGDEWTNISGSIELEEGEHEFSVEYPSTPGYSLEGWYVNGKLVGSTNPITISITSDTTIIAQVKTPEPISNYTLTLSGINCQLYIDNVLQSSITAPKGSIHTIMARADSGYEFKGWSDGDTTNPRGISLSSDMSFTAITEAMPTEAQCTLILSFVPTGIDNVVFTVDNLPYDPSVPSIFRVGSEHVIRVDGRPLNYGFSYWYPGGYTVNPYTLTIPNAHSYELTAVFVQGESGYDLSVGGTNCTCYYELVQDPTHTHHTAGIVPVNAEYIITCIPNEGTTFKEWNGYDGKEVHTIKSTTYAARAKGDAHWWALCELPPKPKIKIYIMVMESVSGSCDLYVDGTPYKSGNAIEVQEETTHVISASPKPGYAFKSWYVGTDEVSTQTISLTTKKITTETNDIYYYYTCNCYRLN